MSRRFLLLLLPLLGSCFAGCGRSVCPTPSADGFTALLEHGSPAARLRGVWRSRGYGYVLNVGPQLVEVYDEAAARCWRDPAASAALAGEMSGFRLEEGGNTVAFVNAADGTEIRADRLEHLPPACQEDTMADAVTVFDALSATMEQHYALCQQRGVDWRPRSERLRPLALAAADENGLFDVLQEALAGIVDPHLSLHAEIGGRVRRRSFGKTATLAALRPGFEAQQRVSTTTAYYHAWTDADFARIQAELLGGKGRWELQGNLLWGKTAQGVGYLALRSMQDFGREGDRADDAVVLAAALDRAIADLHEAPALILDLAVNPGGSDGAARLVASRFTEQRWPAYAKQARGAATQRFDLIPADAPRYSGPVYLLTSDLTVSAAEVLVLSMRSLPQVKQVGATTRGAFSNVLEKTLPNGWRLGLSNETYFDSNGQCYEGKGLEPEIALTVFRPQRIDEGHLEALNDLLAEIRRRQP